MTLPKTMKMSMCRVKSKVLEKSGCQYVNHPDFKNEPFTYTFSPDPFDLSLIDKNKSLDLVQTRWDGKIDQDCVNKYALFMKEGDEFPAMAVFKMENDWFIADGYHTFDALRKNKVEYVEGIFLFAVNNPIEVAATFNVRTTGNSEPLSTTLERAYRLYKKREVECLKNGTAAPTRESWALKFGISKGKFGEYYNASKIKKDLLSKGIKADKFKEEVLLSIGKIFDFDAEAGRTVASFVDKYNIDSSEVKKLKEEFLDPQKNAHQKQQVIDRHERSLISGTDNGTLVTKKRSRRKGPEVTFKEGISKLANVSGQIDPDIIRDLMVDPLMNDAVIKVEKFIKILRNK